VFEGSVGNDSRDGVLGFVDVGDVNEVCEGLHGKDWEWEAEGDGGQVQGSEAVERERGRK
jgi:hypothetical protein